MPVTRPLLLVAPLTSRRQVLVGKCTEAPKATLVCANHAWVDSPRSSLRVRKHFTVTPSDFTRGVMVTQVPVTTAGLFGEVPGEICWLISICDCIPSAVTSPGCERVLACGELKIC